VHTGRTHGPNGKKALHDKLFLSGLGAPLSGVDWPNHQKHMAQAGHLGHVFRPGAQLVRT